MTAEHGTPDFPQFEDLLSGYEELRVHGHFDKRRTDLLSITGTGRTESVHSDVVAWLLDPTGSHGLRSSVLGAILTAGWGEEAAEGVDTATIDRETGRIETRSDLTIEYGSQRLIIENKVDAPQQPTQCDDLFREWGTAARYLLLSPDGKLPHSARLPAARRAWRSLSYGSLAKLLSRLVVEARGPGRVALADYIETLAQQFPSSETFEIHREADMSEATGTSQPEPGPFAGPNPFDTARITYFLKNRQAIRELADIESDVAETLRRDVRSLLGPIQLLLEHRYGPVAGGLTIDGARHPLFWQPGWAGADGKPLAGIGLAWDGADPSRRCLYSGLFVPESEPKSQLKGWLRRDLKDQPTDDWIEGIYPVAYRYLPPSPDWWERLPAWHADLAESVDAAWQRFAPRVDAALAQPPMTSPHSAEASPPG